MSTFDRRALLQGIVVLTAGAGLASCSASGPSPTRSPTPTATPVPTGGGGSGSSARPEHVTSYGVNGTHFPDDVPWPGERAATELVAECSWTDIARCVQSLDAEAVAGGVIIRVEPGTLPGSGSGSSARPVLASIGSEGWTRNVLIVPRDGFGSVVVGEGARFEQCARLSFFGFLSSYSFVLTRCVGLQLGWSRWAGGSITRGGSEIGFYELVLGFRQDEEDTSALRPTERYPLVNVERYGCVFGPSVKPEGSKAHCDTIQLEGTGDGSFGPFTSVDCVDYGSSNAAMMLTERLSMAEYRNCLILGGDLPWRVYPLRPGDYQGTPNSFSGGGADVRLYDSVVSGAVGRTTFTTVENSSLSYAPADSQQPAVGSWDVNPSIESWSRDDIFSRQSVPDYEIPTLSALWRW